MGMGLKIQIVAALLLVLATAPANAQYGGPALLGRGEAPAAMAAPQVSFRPFVQLGATFDTGLAGVALTSNGDLGTFRSFGARVAWGVSGSHSWRHTTIGIDYRGSIFRRTQQTSFDSINQSLLLGVTHDVTRHVRTAVNAAIGTFARDFGMAGLAQTVPFDPITAYIPRTDFFDNRTNYMSTSANLVVQKTARLSFGLGGTAFLARRRSQALAGTNGAGAKADVHYRLSRRSTIGGFYDYARFFFTRTDSSTDLHSFSFAYAARLSRWWEFSGYGGVMHMESKYVQPIAIDPVVAEILGITNSFQIVHRIRWNPSYAGRISRTFSRGVAYASAARSVTPGNGLFLTSDVTMLMGGYSYTGLRRWSLSATAMSSRSKSLVNVRGGYNSTGGGVSMSRKLISSLHLTGNYTLRQYQSSDFTKYNRLIHTASIGLGFTPGEVPLRVW